MERNPVSETVQVEAAPNGNKNEWERSIVRPKGNKLRYRLIDFAGRRSSIDERKPASDGFYENEKLKLKLPIDGNYLFNEGTEAWIDVNTGYQITNFNGVRNWEGPDGRFLYEAAVGKMWAMVLAAKMGDLLKYAKIAVILILVAVASPFIALLLKGS